MREKYAPLSRVRVVDLGVGMSAALAVKLLVDGGATVVRNEPPEGDPFYDRYTAYRFWQHGKSLVSDPAVALADAEVCVIGGEDYPGMVRRDDANYLRKTYPRLVILDIKGSHDGSFPAVELFAQVRSGVSFEHHADRPIMFAFPFASYGAAMHGVTGALSALYRARLTGEGCIVATSLLQGALAWSASIWATAERPPESFTAMTPKGVVASRFRCADDRYIHFCPGVAGTYHKLYHVLGIDNSCIDPTDRGIPTDSSDPKRYFGDMARISAHAANKTSTEVLSGLGAAGVPASLVLEPGECWDTPQVVHNGIIARDEAGWRYVGNPIDGELLPASESTEPIRPAHPSHGPLAGIRIVDCGSFAAGPHSSVILGDLGADVIKVERLDGDPLRASFHLYASSSRGKRSIAVDAKSSEGAEIIARICRLADIVHHNFRPDVSARLGLDAASLARLNPRIIVLESSAYGFSGPDAQLPGFDPLFQALAGHERLAGGADNPPLYYRLPIADYGNAMIGAVALAQAIIARQGGGAGAAVFVNLMDSALFLMAELVQSPAGEFVVPVAMGAEQLGCSPVEAIYQTEDGWIAVAARGATMVERFGAALGVNPEHRQSVAGVIRRVSTKNLLDTLATANVWAVACIPSVSTAVAGMESVGIVCTTQDEQLGRVRQIGRAINMTGTELVGNGRGRLDRIGGSTVEILCECGYAQSEIDTFFARRVVA